MRLTLPFALIEPQLSQGRVSIGRELFLQALPEDHREVLSADADLTEVPLPLQEVFQNLPASALSIRGDQVTEETGTHYPTPFSQKADEDAARFGTPKASTGTETAVPDAKADESPVENAPFAAEVEADASLDTTPEPPANAEAALEPPRDIPLDQEASVVEDKSPADPETEDEKAVETPVESRDIDLGIVHEETPAAQAPTSVPEPTSPVAVAAEKIPAPPALVPEVSIQEPSVPVKPKPATVPVRSTANDWGSPRRFS